MREGLRGKKKQEKTRVSFETKEFQLSFVWPLNTFLKIMAGRSVAHKGSLSSQLKLLGAPLALIHLSVWPRVKLEVMCFTFFAILIYFLNVSGLITPSSGWGSMTSVLSMGEVLLLPTRTRSNLCSFILPVTGLMVSFRSNSSYDRQAISLSFYGSVLN